MAYDWKLADELGQIFYRHGIEEADAFGMVHEIGCHKYVPNNPRTKRARRLFCGHAMRTYTRNKEVYPPESFGRWKGSDGFGRKVELPMDYIDCVPVSKLKKA